MNLTQVMAAAAVGTIVTLGATLILTQNVKVQARSNLQSDLDQSHLISMMMLKNQRLVAQKLGLLDPSVATDATKFKLAPNYEACFGKKGVNCSTDPILVQYSDWKEVAFDLNHNCTGNACKVTHIVKVRIPCNQTACFGIQLSNSTSLQSDAGKINLVQKKSDISMPAVLLASKANVLYKCAQNSNLVMTGINWDSQDAQCLNEGSFACNNEGPLFALINTVVPGANTDYQCQKTENKTCSDGLGSAGAFLNDSNCKTFAAVTTPPPDTPPNGLPTSLPPTNPNVDCVLGPAVTGAWTNWSQPTDQAVDGTTGCGFRSRTWTKAILQAPSGTGAACGPTTQNPAELQTKACYVAPTMCVLSDKVNLGLPVWYPDAAKTCGEKRQNWKKTATLSAAGTVACTDVTGFDVVDSTPCDPGPCQFTWSDYSYGPWSNSIDSCGERIKTRTATITKWGTGCPVPSQENTKDTADCPAVNCVLDTACTPVPSGNWSINTTFQGQAKGCGTRPNSCVTAVKTPERNGGNCPSEQARTTNTTEGPLACPSVDCVGSWSSCDCATQTVTYNVTTPADGYNPKQCLDLDGVTVLKTGDQRACTATELAANKCSKGGASCDVGGGSYDGSSMANFIWNSSTNSSTPYSQVFNPSQYRTDQRNSTAYCGWIAGYYKVEDGKTVTINDTEGSNVAGGKTGSIEFLCVNGNVQINSAKCDTTIVFTAVKDVSNISIGYDSAFSNCDGYIKPGQIAYGYRAPCYYSDTGAVIYANMGGADASCGPANNTKFSQIPYATLCGSGSSLNKIFDMGSTWAWVCNSYGGKPINCRGQK